MTELPLLISPQPRATHPSYQAIRSMATAWVDAGGVVADAHYPGRIARRLLGSVPRIGSIGKGAVVIPLMGPRIDWLPSSRELGDAEVYLHCWDVWPTNGPRWQEIFERIKPRKVSMTSSEAVERWRSRGIDAVWVPEAVEPERFDLGNASAQARDIDVLELGRKWEWLHERITGPLSDAGRVHLYQPDERTLIFPSDQAFVHGMLRSKTVVCVPGSRSHPEKCGPEGVLTLRYLESMAAGALPVGEMPADLLRLAGYDPGTSLIVDSPGQALLDVLGMMDEFEDLIHRNLEGVRDWGSWASRVRDFRELVEK